MPVDLVPSETALLLLLQHLQEGELKGVALAAVLVAQGRMEEAQGVMEAMGDVGEAAEEVVVAEGAVSWGFFRNDIGFL